jgi:hypothetical protein
MRRALVVAAIAATVAGCSGVSATPPGAGFAPLTPTAARSAKKQDLLYISEYGGGVVDVFSYPQGVFEGNLSGIENTPMGECVDKAGDLWIVESGGHPQVQEFAHGGSDPIASLSDEGQSPYGCSVDPLTGNLAVTSEFSSSSFQGSVSVWTQAQGTPVTYVDSAIELMLWCGYDNKGNLFVDGLQSDGDFQLGGLPKGGQSFTNFGLKKVRFPGNLQWDGTAMTVGDPSHPKASSIDRLDISGSKATVTGITLLKQSYEIYGSWIQGGTVIGPDDGQSISTVQLWKYPAGGNPTVTLSKGGSMFFDGPFGAAVSPAR